MVLGAVALAASAEPATRTVLVHLVDASGTGRPIGHVIVRDTAHGLVLEPALAGLTPGLHGFHVHQNPSCEPAERSGTMVPALAAGGHFDPDGAGRHGTPWGDGHRGDLPPLFVDSNGHAAQPVLAPRLRVADLAGRSLVIHGGGDNHADRPAPLGGGGARVACGIF
ncbi:MAG: superoxide dismutase family protein [Ectothiorhodospiraceae bacterium]|nr:superoxide dismutase family protein [Ectothiorhodospiraceae bacterium]